MKSQKFKYLSLVFLPFLIVVIVFLIIVTRIDFSDTVPQLSTAKPNCSFYLPDHLANVNNENLQERFPYCHYCDSADVYNITSIMKNIESLDSINSIDQMLNKEVLSVALTDSLLSHNRAFFQSQNLDTLILLLQWAEKFNCYADIDRKNRYLYKPVYDFWMQYVVRQMEKLYDDNYLIKYNHKFIYLRNRCEEKKYTLKVGYSNIEKAFNYFINGQFPVLWNKFWTNTSTILKLLTALIVVITLYGYYCIIKIHLKTK